LRDGVSARRLGVIQLSEASDGWLALVRLPDGRLTVDAARALARATELGNGVVELTARADLRVRGLAAADADALARLLTPVGLLPAPDSEWIRNVLASPLPGRHPASLAYTDALVAALDSGLGADGRLRRLSHCFLFAVDDGSRLALDPRADVGLLAERPGGFRLLLAGRETTARVGAHAAAALALRAVHAFARTAPAAVQRVEGLREGPATLARWMGLQLTDGSVLPARALTPGFRAQRDGRAAATILPPAGRLTGAQLSALAGLGELRVGPNGTLSLLDLSDARAREVRRALAAIGQGKGRGGSQ
jgi:precorrin-3B synthase